MNSAFLIACGGALGALARWFASTALQRLSGASYPVGTLAVNVLGCLVAGWLVGWLESRSGAGDALRLFLVVGLLGGFTTFSAFGVETLALARDGRGGAALLYALASVLLGVSAAALGWRLGR